MLGNYWQHSINGRQMEGNLRNSLQGIQENSSSDIKISTALALSKLPAADVVTGSVFSFQGAALKDQKNGFRQTVNKWLKEFPVGTTFTIDVAGVNLASHTPILEFESKKGNDLIAKYHSTSKKLDGLNPTIRIKVAIPVDASETGDSDRSGVGEALAAKPTQSQETIIGRMLMLMESNTAGFIKDGQLDPDMVKLSVAENIPPVVLDVLRFIAQEKGFPLVRTRPASDRRLAGYIFTESSEPVRIDRHSLRISDESSLTSESRRLLREAVARY